MNKQQYINLNMSRQRNSPVGFTLLELLLALALSTVLLAAIGTAIGILARTSTVGREQTQRTQLTRALFHQFERDLRSVVYIAVEEDEDDDDESEDGSTTISVESEEDIYNAGSFGVVGGTDWIQFTITNSSIPSTTVTNSDEGSLTTTEDEQAVYSLCNRRIITYQLATGGDSTFSSTVTINTVVGDATGLARFEHEACSTDNVANAISEKVLASEVIGMQLRYFDGADWVTEWDSAVLGFIPQAIEITLELVPTKVDLQSEEEPAATTHRYVVALPLAKQFVGENEI